MSSAHSPDASSCSARPPQPPAHGSWPACGGGGEDAPPAQSSASAIPQSEIDKAMDTETTLTFWTWVPDIKNEVKLFTTKYPKIKVELVNVGQGAPHYQKLRTAIQSGQGAPDVAQVEFQYINSFTLGDGSLLDLTPYAPADAQGRLRRTGSGPRSIPTVACGASRRTPVRWACCTARTCSPRPASRCRRPTTTSPPRPRRTTPRTRRATWSTWPPTSPVRSWPTCGRPVSARSRSTASRRSRSTWRTTRPRRWSSSGATW